MSTCGTQEDTLRIGNTIDVWSQLNNRETPDTPVVDATASFEFVDDSEGNIGGTMTWNPNYPVGTTTGAYVGQIPSTAQLTDGTKYKIVYKGSGGGLNGVWQDTIKVIATDG